MKNLILLISILLTLGACSQNDEEKEENNSIIGTWQWIEIYGSDGGGPVQWRPVKDGYTYTFNSDGTFTSTRFSECDYGNYSIEEDKLILTFGCEGFTTNIENPEGVFIEKYLLKNSQLILTPTYLTCIEGCDYKFKRILK